jgi:ADP-ribose pyrophosphatase YjhB (NUDIX family)
VARTEHYYDPQAPTANSIVVAVTAFVTDAEGRVLLVHRTDNDLWALPGGAQEIGEYIAEAVVRETKEEAGVDVEVAGIVGVYTNPNHVVEFSDGEVRQQFSICFRARCLGGELGDSNETSEARWVSQDQLDELPIHPSMRLRIDHGFENRLQPYIG